MVRLSNVCSRCSRLFGKCAVALLIAGLPPLPALAGVPGDITKQDIFTSASFPSCHASTVVELKNGDWLAAWFGGTAEGKPDVAIWSARHTSSGWSAPMLLVREPEIASWNPVLFYTRDGRLWLYYKFGPVAAGWTGARMFSTDNGMTWSTPQHLPAGILGPIRAKPYVAPDGIVVSGSSVESYHAWAAWVERSIDGGDTFTKIGPYTLTDKVVQSLGRPGDTDPNIGNTGPEQTTGLIQPTVLPVGDLSGNPQHLRFYARSTSNIGHICVSDSYDEGKLWSVPRPLDVPNPNSGMDVVALRDGRFVLIYNPTATGRSPLALAVSRDGLHFKQFFTLEDTPGQEFSYPALIQLKDGNLLATYTWHRTRIREAFIPLSAIPRP